MEPVSVMSISSIRLRISDATGGAAFSSVTRSASGSGSTTAVTSSSNAVEACAFSRTVWVIAYPPMVLPMVRARVR